MKKNKTWLSTSQRHGITLGFCVLALLILWSSQSLAATINVPADYATIQAAIDAAGEDDEIIVSPGTYQENIYIGGKNILLRSTEPTNPAVVEATIIDGGSIGSVIVFSGSETANCVLSGFTIRNGRASGGAGIDGNATNATIQYNTITGNEAIWEDGGGLWNCHGTIQYNTISENSAANRGGGLFQCNGTILQNTIHGNLAAAYGGGLSQCDGTIQYNTIAENSATENGGGLYNCDGTIQNNTIADNSADHGGGLYSCDGTIQNNTIVDNSADYGGGLLFCKAPIINNTICRNFAGSEGGGIGYCRNVINNIIWGNSATDGAGVFECIWVTIEHNIIMGNSATRNGGGLSGCWGSSIQNNIIWGNSADTGSGIFGNCTSIAGNSIIGNSASSLGAGIGHCYGEIQLNSIVGNSAPSGAGLWGCHGPVRHNLIAGNSASLVGGGLFHCGSTLENNAIYDNSAFEGGALYGCDGTIQNNAIYGNSADSGGGLSHCLGVMKNNIFWGNTAATGAQLHQCVNPLYSCIQDWTGGGTGNISSDPLFVDPECADFQLQDGSPCIDAGEPAPDYNDACRPPAKGTERNDVGTFGGPLNCAWQSLPTLLHSWSFSPTPEGWTSEPVSSGPSDLEHWEDAQPLTDSQAVGLTTPYDETTHYFGLWDSLDSDPVCYSSPTLYRVDWLFSTNRETTNAVPSLRFRIGLDNQRAFAYSHIYPGDWLPLPHRPGAALYQLFFEPPIASPALFLAFSVVDWTSDFRLSSPAGSVYLEEVSVHRYQPSAFASWKEEGSFSDFSSWTESDCPPYTQPTYNRSAEGVSLTSGINADLVFGAWDSPTALFSLEPFKLYRLTSNVSANPQLGGPQMRLRVHTDDYRYAWYTHYLSSYTAGESALPPKEGAYYHLYLTLPYATQSSRCSFDLIDFSNAMGGTVTLHDLSLHSHPF